MRIKRLKHCKKRMHFYQTNYGFRPPFQILVDLTFCQFALTFKVNIKEQVEKYIENESFLYTTNCILEEGKLLGPQLHGALTICKQYKLRKCNHNSPVSAQQCIRSMIGKENEHHFIVASQDKELCAQIKAIPGVPLLHIHYNALVLEKPSMGTIKKVSQADASKPLTTSFERSLLQELKSSQKTDYKPTSRRKIKGVNPLSIKKKKKKIKETSIIPVSTDGVKKRKRKRIKVAKHVLDDLRKKDE